MDVELMVGLIVGGSATFTSLLIVGVQIIFYTKSFEDEYYNKVEKIKLRLKTDVDEYIIKLTSVNIGKIFKLAAEKKYDPKKMKIDDFYDEIKSDLIEIHELDELLDTTFKHNKWTHFMVDCKKLIRQIGSCTIICGLIILGFFLLAVIIDNLEIIPFLIMALFFFGMYLLGLISSYREKLKNVDLAYERLQSGLDL